jgi:hypothetical protein
MVNGGLYHLDRGPCRLCGGGRSFDSKWWLAVLHLCITWHVRGGVLGASGVYGHDFALSHVCAIKV